MGDRQLESQKFQSHQYCQTSCVLSSNLGDLAYGFWPILCLVMHVFSHDFRTTPLLRVKLDHSNFLE